MPPRGRPTKRAKAGMDAALKAMSAYSFPWKLVRDTVYELLEAYGGDHGWGFIEDDSYSDLIHILLDKQQDGTAKRVASLQNHGRSGNGSPSSGPNMKAKQAKTNELLNSSSFTKMPGTCFVNSNDYLPSKRRRPYHGWIGKNDDEDVVLMQLEEAPFPAGLRKLLNWVGNPQDNMKYH